MKKKASKTIAQPTSVAISGPSYVVRNVSSITEPIKFFLSKFSSQSNESSSFTSTTNKRKGNMKKYIPAALVIIALGGVIIFASRMIMATSKQTATDTRTDVPGPRASLPLNKEFSFPILDAKGKEVTRLKYAIQDAQLRDEIIVKGSRATAVKGRTFLILNIKIVNDYDKGIDISARDYVRLVVNGNESELLAADIHNDPVSVQPISTKMTRLGFPINDTDKDIVLKIGEIKGNKESIPLTF